MPLFQGATATNKPKPQIQPQKPLRLAEQLHARGLAPKSAGGQGGFWKAAATEVFGPEFDTSKGWRRRLKQQGTADNFLNDAAWGHIQRNPDGTWNDGRTSTAVLDAQGRPISGGGGGGAPLPPAGGGAAGQETPWTLDAGTEGYIKKLLSGEGGPMTREITDRQTADAAAMRSAQLANANRSAAISQARGGMAGPAATAQIAGNSRDARGGFSEDAGRIQTTATLENHKAQMQGLQAGLQELQSRRDLELGRARNANEAESIRKRYDAEMADVNARLTISQNEIAAQERAQGASMGAAAGAQSREQEFWRERFNLGNEREDFIFQRNLPLQFMETGLGSLGDDFYGG